MGAGLSAIEKRFLDEARQQRRKIAIGIWRPDADIVASLMDATKYVDLTVVGSEVNGLHSVPTKNDDEASHVIVEFTKRGEVEGFVRAQLKDSYTHKVYLEAIGRPEAKKAFVAFVSRGEQWFSVVSCSNYNALTLEDKRYEILRGAEWLEDNLGIRPTIAVMSTRRPTGRKGEFPLIDEIAERCETVAAELRDKSYDVQEYYIEYEKAIWDERTLLCPSIGMIGNTWLKALVYNGGWRLVGTPYLDQGTYYDDTPRNYKEWFWPIISTAAWLNRGKL